MRFGIKRILAGAAAIASLATAAPFLAAPAASAASASPAATVNGTVTLSPTSGTKSGTSYAITLNSSSACPGDTATGNYNWQTFMIDATVDLQTVQFGGTGPVLTESSDTGKFAKALYTTASARVINRATDIGSGTISGIPTLKFSGAGTVADGTYHVGVACTLGSAGTTQLKSYWSRLVTFSNSGANWAQTSEFTSMTPARVFDTRPGNSGLRAVTQLKTGPDGALRVKIGGVTGVPSNVAAVAINLTATETSGPGFVTVYPCGTRPTASSLNFATGETVSNTVIAPLNASGEACFFSSVPAHIIADVSGWFPVGASYTAVTPNRVFDTRPGSSALRVVSDLKVSPTNVTQVKFTDLTGVIPASGVSAVSMNVTVTETDGPGFVTVYPCGTRPDASSLNFTTGQTIANAVISQVSGSGEVCFYSSTNAHIIADVNGWFATGSTFTPVTPARAVETRSAYADGLRPVSKGLIDPATPLQVKLTDLTGVVPASGVTAVSLNVTATGSGGPGFITVYPCGTRPTAASITFGTAQTIPNAVIAPVSATGEVCFYSMTPVDLIVDVNGWFS